MTTKTTSKDTIGTGLIIILILDFIIGLGILLQLGFGNYPEAILLDTVICIILSVYVYKKLMAKLN